MPVQDLTWNTIPPSAFGQALGLLRGAVATPRPHGAMRYRCPLTGSYVLITDDPTLSRFAHPLACIRCADCGGQHLVSVETHDPANIVALAGKP